MSRHSNSPDRGALDALLMEDRRFPPPADFRARAVLNDSEVYRRAAEDREAYWAEWAKELSWFEPWKEILRWQPPNAQWFVGGKLNVSYNCLDRHVEEGHGDRVALFWEGEPGDARRYTYTELLDEVCRFANVLKGLGVQKGDRVTIYLPMIPEVAVAMLAVVAVMAVLGVTIYNAHSQAFEFKPGPIFTHFLLADEINRTPPKTQAALLEAMQEYQVTVAGKKHSLAQPFFVLATQNPIEQEGTYPLPEAQLDRFLLKIRISYPSKEEEREIVERIAIAGEPKISPVVDPADIVKARELCKSVYIDRKLKDYIIDLVFATREPEKYGLPELKPLIRFGASPRASINLTTTVRAMAFLKRRGFVIPEDIKELAADVLRHRVILSYEAEAEEMTADDVIQKILASVEVP